MFDEGEYVGLSAVVIWLKKGRYPESFCYITVVVIISGEGRNMIEEEYEIDFDNANVVVCIKPINYMVRRGMKPKFLT